MYNINIKLIPFNRNLFCLMKRFLMKILWLVMLKVLLNEKCVCLWIKLSYIRVYPDKNEDQNFIFIPSA